MPVSYPQLTQLISGNTSGATAYLSTGTVVWAGGDNITLSQNGNSVTISGAAGGTGAGALTMGMSTNGNTSGTTGLVQSRYVFAGGNNITLSQSVNGESATLTISAFAQTAGSQTIGMSNIGNTSGTTGVASGNQVGFLFAGGNNITLSQSINGASGTITISAFTQTAGSQTFGMSDAGNTSGTTGMASGNQVRFLLAGGNNITLSQSLNGASGTITVSAAAQTVESQTFGMSNLGNTSGTTGIASGAQVRFLLAGGNNITLSQSINGASGTITVSAAAQTVESNTFGVSNLGNTSGTSGVISGNQLAMYFAGGQNIVLSQSINGSSATITISQDGTITRSIWDVVPLASYAIGAQLGNGSFWVQPLPNHGNRISFSKFKMFGSFSVSSSSNSSHGGTLSVMVGLYSRNADTLSLITSGLGNYQWTNTSDNSMAALTGFRGLTAEIATNLIPGDYWMAMATRSSTAGANWWTGSNLIVSGTGATYLGDFMAASTNSAHMIPGQGFFTATSAAAPASMAFSDIVGTVNRSRPFFNLVGYDG